MRASRHRQSVAGAYWRMSMSIPEPNGASFRSQEGGTEIRIGRHFPHPAKKLWEMLTEPSCLVQWLAPGKIEPRIGGFAKLDFVDSGIVIDSAVTEFAPLKTLAYSWSGPGEPARPLCFILEPASEGTRLVLTLRVPKGEDTARAAAGFEAHFEMLAAALEGVPIKFPFQLFKELRIAYQARAS
jgi:uncharacterized protein YndB with AHSA1/START domain